MSSDRNRPGLSSLAAMAEKALNSLKSNAGRLSQRLSENVAGKFPPSLRSRLTPRQSTRATRV